MKTIRRLYFYLMCLVSAQVVLWAVVNLVRTIFSGALISGVVDWLAGGIAFILVGAPIFWLHWRVVQREAVQEVEEGGSRIRAVFFYAALLSTGIPISYAILAILNRAAVQWMGNTATQAVFGGSQSFTDNMIAVVANLVVLAYFWRALRRDWVSDVGKDEREDASRLHRLVWLVYGLTLLILGLQQVIRFILQMQPSIIGRGGSVDLASGISLILVGLPVWLAAQRLVNRLSQAAQEQASLLRLVVLYGIVLAGVAFTLGGLGSLAVNLLRVLFRVDTWTAVELLDRNAGNLAILVTLGLVWAYYGRQLAQAIKNNGDELRQAALNRIYASILSLAGLVAFFLGLLLLLEVLVQGLFPRSIDNPGALLADALVLLGIGFPLWLRFWRVVQRQAAQEGEAGDQARRSVVRKGALYLILFAAVVGVMISGGWLIYIVLNTLLGRPAGNFWLDFTMQLRWVGLFALFLAYHLRVLRADGRAMALGNYESKSQFKLLVLSAGTPGFGDTLVQLIRRNSPQVAAEIYPLDLEHGGGPLPASDALVLPAELALNQPPWLRQALLDYQGRVIVVPVETKNWVWLGGPAPDEWQAAHHTAAAVKQIVANQPVRTPAPASPWSIAATILAVLFILQIVLVTGVGLISLLFR